MCRIRSLRFNLFEIHMAECDPFYRNGSHEHKIQTPCNVACIGRRGARILSVVRRFASVKACLLRT